MLTYCCFPCDSHQVTNLDKPPPNDVSDKAVWVTTISPDGDTSAATFKCAPRSGEWSAAGDIARGPQGLTISRVEVISTSPNGVTGSVLRKIQVGEILNSVRATIARASQGAGEPSPEARRSQGTRSGGRAGLSDQLLRDVAVAYLAGTAPGQPPGAVKRMAEELGRPEETVRTWIGRARRDGWLGPGVKGRAGAEPGPRLRDLTAEEFARIYPEREGP